MSERNAGEDTGLGTIHRRAGAGSGGTLEDQAGWRDIGRVLVDRRVVIVSEANAFARECFRDIASVDGVLRRIPVNTASVRDRSSPQAEATMAVAIADN